VAFCGGLLKKWPAAFKGVAISARDKSLHQKKEEISKKGKKRVIKPARSGECTFLKRYGGGGRRPLVSEAGMEGEIRAPPLTEIPGL